MPRGRLTIAKTWANRARAHPWATIIGAACRAGYAARGAVYVSIGLVALFAAFELAPRSKSATGALEAWAAWPAGVILLWLIGLGLWGFAVWRALQALFDADGQGRDAKAIASRVGKAISGVVYAALAVSIFGVLDALEDMGEAEDRDETAAAVEKALAMPGGELLVILLGLFVFGCGVGNLVQAARRDFCDGLVCEDGFARRAAVLGKVGYGARGLVFLAVGAFVTLSGIHARGAEAKGTGAALNWMETLPMGNLVLVCIALGLIAFGLFAFVEARFRRLRVRAIIDE